MKKMTGEEGGIGGDESGKREWEVQWN